MASTASAILPLSALSAFLQNLAVFRWRRILGIFQIFPGDIGSFSTGWPSFAAPIAPENISIKPDNSFFSHRTEVLCRRCGSHLGHVFDDGPKSTGQRYCMNSLALQFVATKK
jgi:hypothetical protein